MDSRKSRHFNELIQQPQDAYLLQLPPRLRKKIASHLTTVGDVFSLAYTSYGLFQSLEENINKIKHITFKKLIESILDNNISEVKVILDKYPELLIYNQFQNLEVQSKCSWHKFYAEKPLTMVTHPNRKQLVMMRILLPYFYKLEQKGILKSARDEILSQWVFPDSYDLLADTNSYQIYIEWLVHLFSRESFPHGFNMDRLSDTTENALNELYRMLLPTNTIKLDDYVDVEQLLYITCKTFKDRWKDFGTWNHREAFCIRVIGLLQSLVSRETAHIIRSGFAKIFIYKDKTIPTDTDGPIVFSTGETFFHKSPTARSGIGYQFMSDWSGQADYFPRYDDGKSLLELLAYQLNEKSNSFKSTKLHLQDQSNLDTENSAQAGCRIL